MSERIKVLNEKGTLRFRQFVETARSGSNVATPLSLLTDEDSSSDLPQELNFQIKPMASRVELGQCLLDWLQPIEARSLSRNAGLWNWLSLRLFDQLCPQNPSRRRKILATSHYVLDPVFSHQRYYRHLVRFAWLSTLMHKECARVLLNSSDKDDPGIGQWGEMSEQLGARQDVFGSRVIIQAANLLYLDEQGRIIRGSSSRNRKGVVRRLSDVANQLFLTHDLRTCEVGELVRLLPGEFERWVRDYRKRSSKETKNLVTATAADPELRV